MGPAGEFAIAQGARLRQRQDMEEEMERQRKMREEAAKKAEEDAKKYFVEGLRMYAEEHVAKRWAENMAQSRAMIEMQEAKKARAMIEMQEAAKKAEESMRKKRRSMWDVKLVEQAK